MTKAAYIGVGNTARKIKNIYIGIGGGARKVIAAYIGVNGVAKKWWPTKPPIPDVAPSLSSARNYASAGTINNCVLVAGGVSNLSVQQTTVDGFDESLTRFSATPITVARNWGSGTRQMNGAANATHVFFGGSALTAGVNAVDAYDTAFTKRNVAQGTASKTMLACPANVGVYVVFPNYAASTQTIAYDTSLTKVTATAAYSQDTFGASSTSLNDRAIFAGGYYGQIAQSAVYTYNTSLTRAGISAMSSARYYTVAAATDDYAIISAGTYSTVGSGGTLSRNVDAYNSAFTRTRIADSTASSTINAYGGGTSLHTEDDKSVIFGAYYPEKFVDMYNNALAKSALPPILGGTKSRYGYTVACTLAYSMFVAGQVSPGGVTDTMDVYLPDKSHIYTQ